MIRKYITHIVKSLYPESIFKDSFSFQNNSLKALDQININDAKLKNLHILAVGKAASDSAICFYKQLESFGLSNNIKQFLVVTKIGHIKEDIPAITQIEASHPVCDDKSVYAAEECINFMNKTEQEDTVLVLLSGGASALIVKPVSVLSLPEYIDLNKTLLSSGASINDMNIIRKSFCEVKNGGLAYFSKSKNLYNFAFSDVPDSNFATIGSSPCYHEAIDQSYLKELLNKHIKEKNYYIKLMQYIESEEHKNRISKMLERSKSIPPSNLILADAVSLINNSDTFFKESHKNIKVDSSIGILDTVVEKAIDINLKKIKELIPFSSQSYAISSAGEATVEIPKDASGIGGRNLHFVALMAKKIFFENSLNLSKEDLERISIISIGTDGTDGPTDSAGAWFNYQTYINLLKNNTDLNKFINNFDSYNLFDTLGTLIKTGPTGNNLMDLRTIIIN